MGLFEEQETRKPNLYPWTQDFIDSMWEGHWTPNEFSFKSDLHDFKTELTSVEQRIVVRTLSAIGQIEVAVKKFWARLGDNLPHPSITDLGLVMAGVEVIHNVGYEKLLNVLGLNDVFQENLQTEVIGGRVKYLKKYLTRNYEDSRKQYIYALILFTLFVENVSLFSQFYIILWFGRYRNVLKDTNQQVIYTRLEENIHAQVGIKLVNVLRKEYPHLFDQELEQRILGEAEVAYQCESKVVDWILGEFTDQRISAAVLKEYIKDRINKSISEIGYNKPYQIDPTLHRDFEWMIEESYGNFATDFFHRKPVEYAKANKAYSEEDLF